MMVVLFLVANKGR